MFIYMRTIYIYTCVCTFTFLSYDIEVIKKTAHKQACGVCFELWRRLTLIFILYFYFFFADIGTTSTRVPPQHWRTARRERQSCGRNSRRSPETWSLKAVCLNCAVKETTRAHHQPLHAGSPCCSAPSPPCSHGSSSSAQHQTEKINTQTFLAHMKRRI